MSLSCLKKSTVDSNFSPGVKILNIAALEVLNANDKADLIVILLYNFLKEVVRRIFMTREQYQNFINLQNSSSKKGIEKDNNSEDKKDKNDTESNDRKWYNVGNFSSFNAKYSQPPY